ncbi:putative ribonuclease H-like domain-containing protein [Tanacetum coccineum]
MDAQGLYIEEGIDYDEVFAPVARIEVIRLFLAYALFKDFVVYQMDVKSVFLYGKIEEEVYVYQPPGFKDSDSLDRVYKVEKALYGLHQAPRAWYETLSTYLLDNEFQRGKIDKTLFIKRHKGDILLVQVYMDDIIFGSTKKELFNAFEKLMHVKFQMSSMGELTFFLGLQVEQKKDGIFISQDKYVGEILKKFGFTKVKTASTPIETQKPLLKDENGEEVDVHMYRSMIGSLMYLTSSRLYLSGQPKLGLWYPKDSPFDLVAYTDSDYARASLDRKSTTGGCQFLGCRLISWQCKKQTVVANSTTEAEYVAASSCCGQVKVNDARHKTFMLMEKVNAARHKLTTAGDDFWKYEKGKERFFWKGNTIILNNGGTRSSRNGRRKPKRKDTQIPQSSGPTKHVADEAVYKELDDSLVRAATTASSLEAEQDSESLGKDASKPGSINAIDADEDITLVNDQDDADMFDVNTLTGDEVLAKPKVATKDVNLNVDEVTLTQALVALKSVKSKVKVNVIEESSVPVSTASTKVNAATTTTTATIPTPRKGIVITELAEFDEEERLAREKDETNVALTEEWDDIQAKVDADYQLAQRLQAKEQEQFTTEQKATFKVDNVQETAEVDDDQETTKIKELMEIVPDKEEVVIDAILLDVKPPSIVDWKIHKEGKKIYYQIIRANGSSKMYLVFSYMLKSFDREDLETL